MTDTLLPPNATALERALDAATARIGDVPVPIADLWDAAACPIGILPWIAWGLSADWQNDWTEAQKRDAVANAIARHRIRGTVASVRQVMARHDQLLELVEGWQVGAPAYTFEVTLPLDASRSDQASATFAEAIIRDIDRAKPARSHWTLVQQLTISGAIGLVGAARMARFDRLPGLAAPNPDPSWLTYLQTEDGEPIADESGPFLVEAR